ncbi:MAG: AAA family ATPase [Solirubrobacterales bacterium]
MITGKLMSEMLREATVFLAERGEPTSKDDVLARLGGAFELTSEERQIVRNGLEAWADRFLWMSIGLVKAGWITKDGAGVWSVTDTGKEAIRAHPDPVTFQAAIDDAYRAWQQSRAPAQRRAWLVRGSSVLGVNLVPDWLSDGYCSLAGSQLRAVDPEIGSDELRAFASEDYAHLKHHELKAKVDEIVAFVTKVSAGDVVVTTSEHLVFVGDLTGPCEYVESDGGRSNLRRPVDWRNPDAPIDYADLPAPLPARLQTGSVVLDLTSDLGLIDELTLPATEAGASDDGAVAQPRHVHLAEPSSGLADALFVGADWLAEVRSLLDERRQIVFYGPPGTGKTFIARRLAADLVGPEQVKLVQFHPAYTYEDFFEGYRPVPGRNDGTIAFELKPGPLRKLVDRAREHPEQAFVLIIDEINRANLAKVFGELYFLLEYRDQAVDLLYSSDDEGFTMPTNLYLIGTMNTADRSIALVDGAMRRRFAFVALQPDEEPTRGLLARWSAAKGLGPLAASVLTALNARIDDPDFRIGPAYFMKNEAPDAHSGENLARIWRTSILPLLQEHHYGQWEGVRRHYELDSLLKSLDDG